MAYPKESSGGEATIELDPIETQAASEISGSGAAEPENHPGAEHHALPPLLRSSVSALIFLLIVASPLWFGSVHQPVYLLERVCVFGALIAFFIFGRKRLEYCFRKDSTSLAIVALCTGVLGWTAIQLLVGTLYPFQHTVLGKVALPQSSAAFLSFFWNVVTFVATFALCRAWVGSREAKAEKLIMFLVLSGTLVSITALSHWFYDTGKLFWLFEPDHVFTSVRARWPFVNSNHLAHFLLPVFFLIAGALSVTLIELRDLALTTQRANKRSWALLVASTRVQHRLIRVGLLLGLAVASTLCIAASLSRGSWLAMGVALAVFLLRDFIFGKDPLPKASWADDVARLSEPNESPDIETSALHSRKSRKKGRSKATHITREQIARTFSLVSLYGRPALGIAAAVLVYFFLYGRGSELFADRLEYGLMHSQDDMRWQLYQDTLPLIRDHIFLGVGAGAWAKVHPQYMATALSGINPVYLHSDPLQFLAEMGIIPTSMVLAGLILLVFRCAKVAKGSQGRPRAALSALVCGGLALLIASFFDFPFRIPAITTLAAALLALTAFYADSRSGSKE
jgi:hypothetical protein